MNFQVETSAIHEALRVVSRLAAPDSGNVTITSNGKKVFINSYSETARCSVNVPATVSGKAASFALSLNALRDATKGRKELDITYAKTMCSIKSGAYKAELATVDSMEIEASEDEKGKTIEFTAEQAAWLKSAIATVALKPMALIATFMPVSIKLTDKGAFVACYDANHMAFMNSSEIKGKLELNLPIDTMLAVLDAFGNTSFSIQMSKSNLHVSHKLMTAAIALPQAEENALTLDDVLELAKTASKSDGKTVQASKSEMLAFMDNARAIATKERSEITVAVADGKMKLSVQTVQGTSKAVVKVQAKKACGFAIDFEQLDEAVRKADEEVTIKLVDDAFVTLKLKTSTVVVSLNQS